MAVDDDYNPFGTGIDYAVPPGPYGGGVIFVTLTPEEAPPGSYVYDQHGNLFGIVPGAPPPLPPFASTDEIDPANVDVTPHVPPVTDTDVDAIQGAGPPPAGGPEDTRVPPDFDVPLPSEPPPGQFPEPVAPPGPRGPVTIDGEYERFDRRPDRRPIPGTPKRSKRIRNVPDRTRPPPPPLPAPPDVPRTVRPGRVLRGLGRVLGPVGAAIDIGTPNDLGSGELPFPPIPRVEIPLPQVSLPEPRFPPLPSPPVPEFGRPEVPDVVVVSAPAPQPMPVPRSSQTLPRVRAPGWALLGGLLAPILRRSRWPAPASPQQMFTQPEPATPPVPDPLTPPAPTAGTDPLTPPAPSLLPSPLQSGAPQSPFSQPTQEDQCRCKKCPKCKKRQRKSKPSNTVAEITPYKRRMSAYSLRNLKRGGIQYRRKSNDH